MRSTTLIALLAVLGTACSGTESKVSQKTARPAEETRASSKTTVTELQEGQLQHQEPQQRFLEHMPAPEDCSGSEHLVSSPRVATDGQPLRIIAVLDEATDATLQLWDSNGESLTPHRRKSFGGPPHGQMAELASPIAGAVVATIVRNGEAVHCKRFEVVSAGRGTAASQTSRVPSVWRASRSWSDVDESLWSFFVEALFDYPPDDTQTWTNLHALVQDPTRNLFYGHLGQDEETGLTLEPDCADLPYQLRAYFAWKRGLPFAYRWCSRGAVEKPPTCGAFRTNDVARERSDDADAFEHFAQRVVRPGVHSASGRTHPEDDETDFYPVPLTREALSPGTVYADPYGHVMILTTWIAQRNDESGILMAAEAQPDGTVGRRRFWRGSFLFDPDTTHVGAGFKRFRPLVLRDSKTVALDNQALKNSVTFAPWSLAQYKTDKDAFYERMDELINPNPLNPEKKLLALVDAFDESVQRRVTAVQNGEDYVRAHGTIDMPHGHAIFETSGPWEDYSSPSRDMRLLISLDTVTNFIPRLSRTYLRYGLAEAELPKEQQRLRGILEQELRKRTTAYVRSDDQPQTLSLWQVLHRAQALEMAYNPNDCIERRWGAVDGSKEAASCKRRAPREQQERMERYRGWFAERTRPARGTE